MKFWPLHLLFLLNFVLLSLSGCRGAGGSSDEEAQRAAQAEQAALQARVTQLVQHYKLDPDRFAVDRSDMIASTPEMKIRAQSHLGKPLARFSVHPDPHPNPHGSQALVAYTPFEHQNLQTGQKSFGVYMISTVKHLNGKLIGEVRFPATLNEEQSGRLFSYLGLKAEWSRDQMIARFGEVALTLL